MRPTKKQDYIKQAQKRIAKIVSDKFQNYYLTGGTALAFYFGHRFSEDLDFFTQNYKKEEPDKIMNHIGRRTGFKFSLESEQNRRGLVPMKVYFLELKDDFILKIDFVQDFAVNLKPIGNGVHSRDDIYYRKIIAAVGTATKETAVGRMVPTGRQSAKDLFDIYYLSRNFIRLSDFFPEYFPYNKSEQLADWYRGYDRMELKMEIRRLVPHADAGIILRYLDNEILKVLPRKIR